MQLIAQFFLFIRYKSIWIIWWIYALIYRIHHHLFRLYIDRILKKMINLKKWHITWDATRQWITIEVVINKNRTLVPTESNNLQRDLYVIIYRKSLNSEKNDARKKFFRIVCVLVWMREWFRDEVNIINYNG